MFLSRAVNFKHRFNHKDQGGFPMPHKEGAPIGRYPFGEVINYTLDGLSIHPVTTKIQASFLTQLPERKEANGDFKTVAEFNG